jgi:hypothetical protein
MPASEKTHVIKEHFNIKNWFLNSNQHL